MNIIHFHIAILKEYLTNKILFWQAFLITIIIYILHRITIYYIDSMYADFIYWNFLAPLFIYSFLIIFTINYLQKNYQKKNENIYKIIKTGIIIIFIKIIWNIIKIIFLESNFIQISEKSSLYPILFIFVFWICIYFIAAYFIPHSYFNQKNLIIYKYIIKNMSELILNIIFCIFWSFIIIFVISFVCAKVQNIITITNQPFINHFIEDFLSIFFKIIFGHLLVIGIIKTYKKKTYLKK